MRAPQHDSIAPADARIGYVQTSPACRDFSRRWIDDPAMFGPSVRAGRKQSIVRNASQPFPGEIGPIRSVQIAVGLPIKQRAMGKPRHRALPVSPSRSEELTSELQSLMRISYAVFCL